MTGTLAEMPHEDLYIGMEVAVVADDEYYRINSNHRQRLRPADPLRITSIFNNGTVNVRTIEKHDNRWSGRREEMSFGMSKTQLRVHDPFAPKPRRLGKKPEGDEFIGIDHPGIQWLWDDMGTYADNQGYCTQYDALCAKLGIPGRPRDFTVTQTIGGIPISATVRARSQKEANEMVKEALQGSLPDLETEPADAD